jgi:hypothetical protein
MSNNHQIQRDDLVQIQSNPPGSCSFSSLPRDARRRRQTSRRRRDCFGGTALREEKERATQREEGAAAEDSQFTGGGELELTCLIPRAPRPVSSSRPIFGSP